MLLVYPLQLAVDSPIRVMHAVNEELSSRSQLQHDNGELREENRRLLQRQQRFAALEQENQRLRELLDTSYLVGEDVLVAHLMAVASRRAVHELTLDRGARHGVMVGQAILDANGILGQITEVGPLTSTALLITDPRHDVPVLVNRTGARGIVSGTDDDDLLDLNFVPNNADVQPGDLLVSSGLDDVFPAGYPVGTVATVTIDPAEAFSQIKVAPSAAVANVREVLVVRRHPQSDAMAEREAVSP